MDLGRRKGKGKSTDVFNEPRLAKKATKRAL
jgi:hypothetical protein